MMRIGFAFIFIQGMHGICIVLDSLSCSVTTPNVNYFSSDLEQMMQVNVYLYTPHK